VFFTSTFSATPNANGIDGVIGFSSQSAASFNDLAAAVRFNPDGRIDVRNGGAYAADANVPYSAGASYVINVLIDVLGHSYSVLVNGATVARDYAFRPQQASVASLGNWAWIADSSVGALSVCGLQALTALDTRYLHSFVPYEGRELAAPADGSLAVSNSADTIFLDGTGRAMGSLAYGGTPATDAHSNLYLAGEFQGSYDGGAGSIASLGGTDVYLSKYDGAHRHLWTLGLGSASDDALGTLSVNAEGDSLVGVGSQLIRLSPDGANTWSQPLAAANERCALDPNGGAFVLRPSYPDATSFTLTRVDASGNAAWARSFHEQGADVRFVRSDPAGNAILSGGLNGSIDFVAGTLKATSSEDGEQVFIAKLDQDGRYLWGAIADMNSARAMVVDSAGRTVISGYRVNPFEFRLVRFSADGNGELAEDGSSLTGGIDFGFGLELAVNTTGDVFWHFAPSRPNQNLSFLARISG
jgi:hypothetical protein